MSDHVVGVDLGGSNVRALLSDASGRTVAKAAARTDDGDGRVVEQVADMAQELAGTAGVDWSRVGCLAVGVPGAVDGRELWLAANLPGLDEVDLVAQLGKRLGVPVAVDNDVNLAALAEHRHGLGAGLADFIFIAVGTGVGMGIVASGRLVRGAMGAAGEIAFLPLGCDPFEPANQVHGPLEEIAGGVGVARRYAEASGAESDAPSALEVYGRAAAGDPHAHAVLDAQARAIALAVVSAMSILDPALVVFGGGIGSREDFVARVRSCVARLTRRELPIEVSELGERAGLIGAVELARTTADGPQRLAAAMTETTE